MPSVEKIKLQAASRLSEIHQTINSSLNKNAAEAKKHWNTLRRLFKGKGARLQEQYWPETAAPHFPSIHSSMAFKEWRTSTTTENFSEWLQSKKRQTAHLLAQQKVAYLGESDREQYQVYLQSSLFSDSAGKPFNTVNLETNFSGKGWGIFVLSQNYELFVASHKMANFHHTSF